MKPPIEYRPKYRDIGKTEDVSRRLTKLPPAPFSDAADALEHIRALNRARAKRYRDRQHQEWEEIKQSTLERVHDEMDEK